MSVRSTVPPLPLASSTVYSRADVSESLTIYFIRFSIRPSSSSIILLIVTESPEEYTPPPPPHPPPHLCPTWRSRKGFNDTAEPLYNSLPTQDLLFFSLRHGNREKSQKKGHS